MFRGFWDTLHKPIIALSPMDGVTDAAFRYITDTHGKPDILFTEFTSVEGIASGAKTLLSAFIHHKTSTPTVAQIFGKTPESFYKAAFVVAEMGFDGIDINMGCPDKNVSRHGGGAGLIKTPDRAQKIILETRRGAQDWAAGRSIKDVGLTDDVLAYITRFQQKWDILPVRKELPVSVKTRIGVDQIVTTDWIATLLETQPVNISLHGRTLKQLYSGVADWSEIGKASELTKGTRTTLLGNGDIQSKKDALERIKTYGTDGALIGRASFGNPWIFADRTTDLKERFDVAVEHCQAFERMTPELHWISLRKHMAWYCKGFENAAAARIRLTQASSAAEVEKIISESRSLFSV